MEASSPSPLPGVNMLLLVAEREARYKIQNHLKRLCVHQPVETQFSTPGCSKETSASDFFKSLPTSFDVVFVDARLGDYERIRNIVFEGKNVLPTADFILMSDEQSWRFLSSEPEFLKCISCRVPVTPNDADLVMALENQNRLQKIGYTFGTKALDLSENLVEQHQTTVPIQPNAMDSTDKDERIESSIEDNQKCMTKNSMHTTDILPINFQNDNARRQSNSETSPCTTKTPQPDDLDTEADNQRCLNAEEGPSPQKNGQMKFPKIKPGAAPYTDDVINKDHHSILNEVFGDIQSTTILDQQKIVVNPYFEVQKAMQKNKKVDIVANGACHDAVEHENQQSNDVASLQQMPNNGENLTKAHTSEMQTVERVRAQIVDGIMRLYAKKKTVPVKREEKNISTTNNDNHDAHLRSVHQQYETDHSEQFSIEDESSMLKSPSVFDEPNSSEVKKTRVPRTAASDPNAHGLNTNNADLFCHKLYKCTKCGNTALYCTTNTTNGSASRSEPMLCRQCAVLQGLKDVKFVGNRCDVHNCQQFGQVQISNNNWNHTTCNEKTFGSINDKDMANTLVCLRHAHLFAKQTKCFKERACTVAKCTQSAQYCCEEEEAASLCLHHARRSNSTWDRNFFCGDDSLQEALGKVVRIKAVGPSFMQTDIRGLEKVPVYGIHNAADVVFMFGDGYRSCFGAIPTPKVPCNTLQCAVLHGTRAGKYDAVYFPDASNSKTDSSGIISTYRCGDLGTLRYSQTKNRWVLTDVQTRRPVLQSRKCGSNPYLLSAIAWDHEKLQMFTCHAYCNGLVLKSEDASDLTGVWSTLAQFAGHSARRQARHAMLYTKLPSCSNDTQIWRMWFEPEKKCWFIGYRPIDKEESGHQKYHEGRIVKNMNYCIKFTSSSDDVIDPTRVDWYPFDKNNSKAKRPNVPLDLQCYSLEANSPVQVSLSATAAPVLMEVVNGIYSRPVQCQTLQRSQNKNVRNELQPLQYHSALGEYTRVKAFNSSSAGESRSSNKNDCEKQCQTSLLRVNSNAWKIMTASCNSEGKMPQKGSYADILLAPLLTSHSWQLWLENSTILRDIPEWPNKLPKMLQYLSSMRKQSPVGIRWSRGAKLGNQGPHDDFQCEIQQMTSQRSVISFDMLIPDSKYTADLSTALNSNNESSNDNSSEESLVSGHFVLIHNGSNTNPAGVLRGTRRLLRFGCSIDPQKSMVFLRAYVNEKNIVFAKVPLPFCAEQQKATTRWVKVEITANAIQLELSCKLVPSPSENLCAANSSSTQQIHDEHGVLTDAVILPEGTYAFFGGQVNAMAESTELLQLQNMRYFCGALRHVKINGSPISFANTCSASRCKHIATRGFFVCAGRKKPHCDKGDGRGAPVLQICSATANRLRHELFTHLHVEHIKILHVYSTVNDELPADDDKFKKAGRISSRTSQVRTICVVQNKLSSQLIIDLEYHPVEVNATMIVQKFQRIHSDETNGRTARLFQQYRCNDNYQQYCPQPCDMRDPTHQHHQQLQIWWCDEHAPSWAHAKKRPLMIVPKTIEKEELYVGMHVTIGSATTLQLQLRLLKRKACIDAKRLFKNIVNRSGIILARLKSNKEIVRVRVKGGSVVSIPLGALYFNRAGHIALLKDLSQDVQNTIPNFGSALPEVNDSGFEAPTSHRLSASFSTFKSVAKSARAVEASSATSSVKLPAAMHPVSYSHAIEQKQNATLKTKEDSLSDDVRKKAAQVNVKTLHIPKKKRSRPRRIHMSMINKAFETSLSTADKFRRFRPLREGHTSPISLHNEFKNQNSRSLQVTSRSTGFEVENASFLASGRKISPKRHVRSLSTSTSSDFFDFERVGRLLDQSTNSRCQSTSPFREIKHRDTRSRCSISNEVGIQDISLPQVSKNRRHRRAMSLGTLNHVVQISDDQKKSEGVVYTAIKDDQQAKQEKQNHTRLIPLHV